MRPTPALAVLLTLSLVALAGPALAGEPGRYLQIQIDRVQTVLQDRTQPPDERRRAVRAIVDETFDFQEAARRALGRHWAALTVEDRARFVRLFVDLIDRAYLRRVDGWDGGRLAVVDDTTEGDGATVRATLSGTDGSAVPVVCGLRRSADGRWRVVDVSVDGAGLLGSYRAQFARLIERGGVGHLLERLEAKVVSLQP
jgi:phospholipid transport system substrate-binding protein